MFLKNLRKKIEKNRQSKKIKWKLLVLTKDILWYLSYFPLNLPKIVFLIMNIQNIYSCMKINIKSLFSQKTIAFDVSHCFLYENYKPIYKKLKKKYDIYFIIPENDLFNCKEYLKKEGISKSKIILSFYAKLCFWKLFISSRFNPEINFPFFGKKIQMYHGAGVSHLKNNPNVPGFKALQKILGKFDYHFMIGPQYKEDIERLGLRGFEVGYPKLDKLVNKKYNLKRLLEEIEFENKNLPLVVYAPHHFKFFSLYKYDLKIIKKILKMRVNLIVKLHENIRNKYFNKRFMKRLIAFKKNKNFHLAKKIDSTLYYPIADVVLTDVATNAGFEAIISNKPLIIINSKKWHQLHKKYNSLEKELEKNVILVNSIKEIPKAIINSLRNKNKKSKEKKELVEKIYYNLGNSTSVAVKIIKDIANNKIK